MNLKIGGSNVGKIMYNGQEFGGATKLEPGTILYMSKKPETGFENVHLLSTTKNWSNFNGIDVIALDIRNFGPIIDIKITGDDFKNLDKKKTYKIEGTSSKKLTVSRSIVDGEYRLKVSNNYDLCRYEIRAL